MTFVDPMAMTAPRNVQIEHFQSKMIVVKWEQSEGEGRFEKAAAYEVTVQYFDFNGTMVEPFDKCVSNVEGCAKEFDHPTKAFDDDGLKACVVKVKVKSLASGGVAKRQMSWEAEVSTEKVNQAGRTDACKSLQRAVHDFATVKGKTCRVVVLGKQHHGKSSFINHMMRCLEGSLALPDVMETAPAGTAENTLETKELTVDCPGSDCAFEFVDTPAFPTLTDEHRHQLEVMLAEGICVGARRGTYDQARSNFRSVPHAAILVVSLEPWISPGSDEADYLKAISKVFKTASKGKVAFPYVVVATKLDIFLAECQHEHPKKRLDEIIQTIKMHANTEMVYELSAFKQPRQEQPPLWKKGSLVNTFRMLESMSTFAKSQNTDHRNFAAYFLVVAFMILILGLALAK